MCMLEVSIFTHFLQTCLLDFGTVPIVWYLSLSFYFVTVIGSLYLYIHAFMYVLKATITTWSFFDKKQQCMEKKKEIT